MKRLGDYILNALCNPLFYSDIQGDLDELHNRRLKNSNKIKADFKHLIAVLMLLRPSLIRSFNLFGAKTQTTMIRQYLISASRAMLKYKVYSVINVFGLAIAVATALLLYSFVDYHQSIDTHHEHSERLYRVTNHVKIRDRQRVGITGSGLLAPTMMAEIPEVELAGRRHYYGRPIVQNGNKKFYQRGYYVDPHLTQILEYKFVHGRPSALDAPKTVVVTEQLAQKLFDRTDIMGETILLDEQSMIVKGVIANHSIHSSFKPDLLVSMSTMEGLGWTRIGHVTYVRLKENVTMSEVDQKLQDMVDRLNLGDQEKEIVVNFTLYPLADVHLSSDPDQEARGNRTLVVVLSIVAIFILLIASINYMNLATAQSNQRAKEIGVRKVIGAFRNQIATQFLIESVIVSVISTAIGVGFAFLMKSEFSNLTGMPIEVKVMTWDHLGTLLVLAIFLGLLAGSYPALLLSGFKPIIALKGAKGEIGGRLLRRTLVGFQFIVSIVFIISTLIVNDQLKYIQNKDLGYNEKGVFVIRLGEADQNEVLKSALLKHPDIQSVAASNLIPASGDAGATFEVTNKAGETTKDIVSMASIDDDYLGLMEMSLIKGRLFIAGESDKSIVVNESLVKKYGWEEPIGQSLAQTTDEGIERYQVIGVVRDFNMLSLHHEVTPFAFFKKPTFDWPRARQYMFVRLSTNDLQESVIAIQEEFERFDQKTIFDGWFLDAHLQSAYNREQRIGRIFITVAIIAILVACLGLFGLATFSLERRIKEISVRKILGANTLNVISLVSREFFIVILIASLIAAPIAYYGMKSWLEKFSYHTPIFISTILNGCLIALIIAILTISIQSWRTAKSNPADNLKCE